MKRILFISICIAIPLFSMAQLPREYDYDAAGNRILRKVLTINPAPPAPQDSLEVTSDGVLFFIETIAKTEIKIYPNPTTEKITLEISQWDNLLRGIFKLYSLTGQLLQEHTVHSLTTTVSLANLPKGIYILKVNINNHTEEWKIIKN